MALLDREWWPKSVRQTAGAGTAVTWRALHQARFGQGLAPGGGAANCSRTGADSIETVIKAASLPTASAHRRPAESRPRASIGQARAGTLPGRSWAAGKAAIMALRSEAAA